MTVCLSRVLRPLSTLSGEAQCSKFFELDNQYSYVHFIGVPKVARSKTKRFRRVLDKPDEGVVLDLNSHYAQQERKALKAKKGKTVIPETERTQVIADDQLHQMRKSIGLPIRFLTFVSHFCGAKAREDLRVCMDDMAREYKRARFSQVSNSEICRSAWKQSVRSSWPIVWGGFTDFLKTSLLLAEWLRRFFS